MTISWFVEALTRWLTHQEADQKSISIPSSISSRSHSDGIQFPNGMTAIVAHSSLNHSIIVLIVSPSNRLVGKQQLLSKHKLHCQIFIIPVVLNESNRFMEVFPFALNVPRGDRSLSPFNGSITVGPLWGRFYQFEFNQNENPTRNIFYILYLFIYAYILSEKCFRFISNHKRKKRKNNKQTYKIARK